MEGRRPRPPCLCETMAVVEMGEVSVTRVVRSACHARRLEQVGQGKKLKTNDKETRVHYQIFPLESLTQGPYAFLVSSSSFFVAPLLFGCSKSCGNPKGEERTRKGP